MGLGWGLELGRKMDEVGVEKVEVGGGSGKTRSHQTIKPGSRGSKMGRLRVHAEKEVENGKLGLGS